MITRSKAEQLVKDFVKQHNLDAEEVNSPCEGLMYLRFVVEEDKDDDL